MPIAITEVRNEDFVGFDVLVEFIDRLEQLLGALGIFRDCLQLKL